MSEQSLQPMEQLDFFRQYIGVAAQWWKLVVEWDSFAQETVGAALVRALDEIGAHLVAGEGRHSDADALAQFLLARASAREARYWIERAVERHLVQEELARESLESLAVATRSLNRLIRTRRQNKNLSVVKEVSAHYLSGNGDAFAEVLPLPESEGEETFPASPAVPRLPSPNDSLADRYNA